MPSPPAITGYRVTHQLGRGGMGVVWAGEHQQTGLPVAIKLLHSALDSAELAREVRTIARLTHPGIIPLYDSGEVDGAPYLVMARADSSLQRTTVPWETLRAELLVLLTALAHAHARGVVHRDIKPGNLLLQGGQLWLADFGIAALLDSPSYRPSSGSLPFMAPEQLAGLWRDVGPWTDLFAVGALAYERLLGRRLFTDEALDLRGFHPRAHDSDGLPEPLLRWLEGMMAAVPRERFQCAADAIAALPEAIGDVRGGDAQTADSGPAGTTLDSALPSHSRVISPQPAPATGAASHHMPRAPMPATWQEPSRRVVPMGLGLGLTAQRAIPLAGRHDERTVLWEALRRVQDGPPEVQVLRGPAGMGKSRLARWLGEHAEEVGAARLLQVSYGPEQERGVLQAIRRRLRCEGLDEPELIARLQGRVGKSALGLMSGRMDACWRFLQQWSTQRPLVVWLDDAQWGDEALSLARLAARARRGRVLVLLTLQDEATPPEVRQRVAALPTLALGPLPLDALRALITDRLYVDLSLAHAILNKTQGSPLFTVQLIQDLTQRDALVAGESGFVLRPGADITLPDDLHEVWLERLKHICDLHSREWQALERAAAMGHSIRSTSWERATADLQEGASEQLVQALLHHMLAVSTPGGWRFVHGLLPASLERVARDAGRWPTHCQRAATIIVDETRTLQNRYQNQRWLGTLLWEFDRAAALPTMLQAAHALRVSGRHYALPPLLDRIDGCVDELALGPSHPLRLQAMLFRAIVAARLGQAAISEPLIAEILEKKVGSWEPNIESEWCQLMLVRARLRQDLEEVTVWVDASLALDRIGNTIMALGIKLKLIVLQESFAETAVDEVIATYEAALKRFQGGGIVADHFGLLGPTHIFADACRLAGRRRYAERILAGALAISRKYQDRILEAHILDLMGEIAIGEGQRDAGYALMRDALQIMDEEESGNADAIRLFLARQDLRAGRVDVAAGLLTRALVGLERARNQRYLVCAQAVRVWLAVSRGERVQAEQILTGLEAQQRETPLLFHRLPTMLEEAGDAIARTTPELARRCWSLAQQRRHALNEPHRAHQLQEKIDALPG